MFAFVSKLVGGTFGFKTIGFSMLGTAVVSATLGGWAINEFWLGKNARDEVKSQKQALIDLQSVNAGNIKALNKERSLRQTADLKIKLLEEQSSKREDRIDKLIQKNIDLAEARKNERPIVIREGNNVAKKIIEDNPDDQFVFKPWPEWLRLYANNEGLEQVYAAGGKDIHSLPIPQPRPNNDPD